MAVEVREQPVPEPLQSNQEAMRIGHVARDPEHRATLMLERDLLVEHVRAPELCARDKEELFVGVSGEFMEAPAQRFLRTTAAAIAAIYRKTARPGGASLLRCPKKRMAGP